MVRHQTPFTTWMFTIHPDFTHIDISEVDRVEFTIQGVRGNGNYDDGLVGMESQFQCEVEI